MVNSEDSYINYRVKSKDSCIIKTNGLFWSMVTRFDLLIILLLSHLLGQLVQFTSSRSPGYIIILSHGFKFQQQIALVQ